MEVREPSSDLQQKSLETDSRTFVPHCSKCGMCRSHKFFNKLAPLHSQMFRELRRQLTTLYGDGPGKEVLVAGDALIRVSWRFGGRASSSSASSEDPLPDTDDFEGSRFFLIVSCPALFSWFFQCRHLAAMASGQLVYYWLQCCPVRGKGHLETAPGNSDRVPQGRFGSKLSTCSRDV